MRRVSTLFGLAFLLNACTSPCNEVSETEREVTIEVFQSLVETRKVAGKIASDQYAAAGITHAERFERWLAKLQAYVALNDSESLAKMMNYPLEVRIYDGSGDKRTKVGQTKLKQDIENEKEFCKAYPYFMTNELREVFSTPFDSLIINETPGSILLKMGYVHIRTKPDSNPEDYEVFFIF